MGIAMSIFSVLGTFVIGFSMLPQTIATCKNKQTADLNLYLYLLMGIATLLITFYGVALCVVPVTQPANWDNATMGKYPDRTTIISGYIVAGAAIIFGEIVCTVTAFMVVGIKIANMVGAKKAGITEQQYIDKMLKSKGVKQGVRR